MKVAVIDYGVGNLGSVMRALEELRATPVLVSKVEQLNNFGRLILPGVGNFSDCAALLKNGAWDLALIEHVKEQGKSLLGICVGMQLLADESSEGAVGEVGASVKGLGLIPGRVDYLKHLGCPNRLPHVGWNSVTCCQEDGLFQGIPDGTDFYFVHSYAFVPKGEDSVIAVTDYGYRVPVAIRRGNVWGTQFHPEKSSRAGFKLLANFVQGAAC